MKKGTLFVISGPSGVGKGTILEGIFSKDNNTILSVSATTRIPRPGETEGVHYYFTSKPDFLSKIDRGEFIEWSEHFENYYGTPSQKVEEQLKANYDVILDIDVNGALTILEQKRPAVFIFIAPPSYEDLERRLKNRNAETAEQIKKRLERAQWELSLAPAYDYVVVNDDLDKAIDDVHAIIKAHRCRVENKVTPVKPYKNSSL